jgi:hypothetical protein
MFPSGRSTRNCQVVSQFCSQFHANSQNAESNLTQVANHLGTTTLLEENEI